MSRKVYLMSIFLNLVLFIDLTLSAALLSTTSGIYKGRTVNFEGISVQQYLGIQYARVERRFQRATPIVRNNDDVKNATSFAPFCKPTAGSCAGSSNSNTSKPFCTITYGVFLAESIPNEQCLFLNVFIPNREKPNRKQALFMWIHGGSGQMGTGNLFDGTILAALGDVIVVTFNFRLNIFGFLSSGDERLEGNLGLYDQALVLDWIYDNANALGVDRSRITVGGHSAGAPHAYYLGASPLNQGRIRRLILQSGSPFNIWSHLKAENAMEKFNLAASDNGCGHLESFSKKLTCLQQKDFNAIAEQEHHSYTSANHTNVVLAGNYMSQYQEKFSGNDSLSDVDVLVGSTDDEGIYVAVVPIMMEQNNQDSIVLNKINWTNVSLKFLTAMEPKKTCLHKSALEMYHLDSIPQNCSTSPECYCSAFYNYSHMISDILFNNDYYRFLEERIKFSKRTFIYRYSYRTSQEHPTLCNAFLRDRNLVGHFAELEYTWGSPLSWLKINGSLTSISLVKHVKQETNSTQTLNKQTYTDQEKEFSRQLIEQWSNFIKYGQPASSRLNQTWSEANNLTDASIMHFQPGKSEVKPLEIPFTVQFWLNDCFVLSKAMPSSSGVRNNMASSIMILIFIEFIINKLFLID